MVSTKPNKKVRSIEQTVRWADNRAFLPTLFSSHHTAMYSDWVHRKSGVLSSHWSTSKSMTQESFTKRYPTSQARRSDYLHRPCGISGVQLAFVQLIVSMSLSLFPLGKRRRCFSRAAPKLAIFLGEMAWWGLARKDILDEVPQPHMLGKVRRTCTCILIAPQMPSRDTHVYHYRGDWK